MNSGEQLWQTDEGLFLVSGDVAHHLGEDSADWLTSLRAHKKVPLGTVTKGIDADVVRYKRGARRIK